MWHRVFLLTRDTVPPSALVQHLAAQGLLITPHFRGDDLGWTSGELVPTGPGSPIVLHRYLTKEDELRPELNSFAAELETMDYSPHAGPLMERVIRTEQMIAFRRPIDHADEAWLDRLCEAIVHFFADPTDGLIQIDSRGWLAADGTVLVQEH